MDEPLSSRRRGAAAVGAHRRPPLAFAIFALGGALIAGRAGGLVAAARRLLVRLGGGLLRRRHRARAREPRSRGREARRAISPPPSSSRSACSIRRRSPLAASALLGAGHRLSAHGRSAPLSRAFALLAAAAGALVVLGCLYGIPSVAAVPVDAYGAREGARSRSPAAFGVLFLRPESGLPAALLDRSEAGRELAPLLPAALVLPVVLGWLALAGERAGLLRRQPSRRRCSWSRSRSHSRSGATVSYTSLRRSGRGAAARRAPSWPRARRATAAPSSRPASASRTSRRTAAGCSVNQRLCEILGYAAGSCSRRPTRRSATSRISRSTSKQWELLRRGEISDYGVERRFETKAGEIVYADVRLVREEDEVGRAARTSSSCSRTSPARRLSEGTLRVYERALAATQNGIVITDATQDDHPIVVRQPRVPGDHGLRAGGGDRARTAASSTRRRASRRR